MSVKIRKDKTKREIEIIFDNTDADGISMARKANGNAVITLKFETAEDLDFELHQYNF